MSADVLMPELRKLNYNPETGEFLRHNGKVAGTINSKGYRKITAAGKVHAAHRLAWFAVHGVWPLAIDHVNGNRLDNRICNLRECTIAQNNANVGKRASNRTGFTGVYCERGRWRARISIDGKWCSIGAYATAEDAHSAYLEKAKELRGKFFNGHSLTS